MASDNKPGRPLCKKCPSLAEKGLLGMVYGMCLTCIRNTYNIPHKAPSSRGTAGNSLGEKSSVNNHVEQSGAVDGAVDGAVEPAAGTGQTMSTKGNTGEDQENTGNKGAGAAVSGIGNGEIKPAAAPKVWMTIPITDYFGSY